MRAAPVDVLIVGGGLAGQRCAQTLRALGFTGSITILCEEGRPPYDRPPLSKAMLIEADNGGYPLRPIDWYPANDVRLLMACAAESVDLASATVGLRSANGSSGGRIRYRHLVIATGARARRLALVAPGPGVHHLRSHDDAVKLRRDLARGSSLVILGAGLIGLEVASSARQLGCEVTVIDPGRVPLSRSLPALLGEHIAECHRANDIRLKLGCTLAGIRRSASGLRLTLNDGSCTTTQSLLLAIGGEPATEWIAHRGLGPGAIAVDVYGRTAVPGIYAAGDAARCLDANLPAGHWESAARQGSLVAHAILGRRAPAHPPPMFWSDQHGHRIQFVGRMTAGACVEVDRPIQPDEPFTAWLTDHGQPLGALLFDSPRLLATARHRIAGEDGLPPSTCQREALEVSDVSACNRRERMSGARRLCTDRPRCVHGR